MLRKSLSSALRLQVVAKVLWAVLFGEVPMTSDTRGGRVTEMGSEMFRDGDLLSFRPILGEKA